ncbi:MAG: hypothetical protein AAGK33_05660 [Pseudomonadota bacterium]
MPKFLTISFLAALCALAYPALGAGMKTADELSVGAQAKSLVPGSAFHMNADDLGFDMWEAYEPAAANGGYLGSWDVGQPAQIVEGMPLIDHDARSGAFLLAQNVQIAPGFSDQTRFSNYGFGKSGPKDFLEAVKPAPDGGYIVEWTTKSIEQDAKGDLRVTATPKQLYDPAVPAYVPGTVGVTGGASAAASKTKGTAKYSPDNFENFLRRNKIIK